MSITPPQPLVDELARLGPVGRRRAAALAAAMIASDVSGAAPRIVVGAPGATSTPEVAVDVALLSTDR